MYKISSSIPRIMMTNQRGLAENKLASTSRCHYFVLPNKKDDELCTATTKQNTEHQQLNNTDTKSTSGLVNRR